jgi:DnaJ-class molecular chaperone
MMAPKIIECPKCDGLGYQEEMIELHWNGTQVWRQVECDCCHGERVIEQPVEEQEEMEA